MVHTYLDQTEYAEDERVENKAAVPPAIRTVIVARLDSSARCDAYLAALHRQFRLQPPQLGLVVVLFLRLCLWPCPSASARSPSYPVPTSALRPPRTHD
jgi:hypothetical protein